MNSKENIISLSPREVMYLQNTSYLPLELVNILEESHLSLVEECDILLSHDNAEKFRETFTNRLAKVGFDADYELTSEGEMLEQLIDRFHIKN